MVVDGVRAAWRFVAVAFVTSVYYVLWLATRATRLVSPRLGQRSHHAVVRSWAKTVNGILGVEVTVEGTPPQPPYFLVSNHLSYLDITVFFEALDGFFLAKSEIAGWPLMGLVARSTGTLFVDRSRKSDLVRVIGEVESVLARGSGVIVFPEGTSTRGQEVLPFRPSLFEVAMRTDTPVSHAAVTYETPPGAPPADLRVCWWGDMPFVPHFMSLLTLPSIQAKLTFGTDSITAGSRKDLASLAQAAVVRDFVPVRPCDEPSIA